MNWSNILDLRAWTPLCEVGADAELVMDGVYRVGQDVYLRTQLHNRKFETGDSRAPFVTRAYWSPSLEGVRRLVAGDPTMRVDGPQPAPPTELALGTQGLYSELIKHVPATDAKVAERAVYSNKGAFLCRVISIGRMSYCFPSHEDKDEQVFLIEISLVK